MKQSIQTVQDLKQVIDHLVEGGLGDQPVGIVVHEEGVVLGPTPTVPIQWVSAGFDWDAGQILIQPQTRLKKDDGMSHLNEIQNHYEALIYEYEAGLLTVDDDEAAFKSYVTWKQWVETSKAMALHYQLATAKTLTLSKNDPAQSRLLRQIKQGLIPMWTLVKESDRFFTIERISN